MKGNPNLKRRGGPGFWALFASPLLKPWLRLFRKGLSPESAPLTVFQSYLVGDLFMALPALKVLAREFDIRVVCRPDCVEILRSEGLEGIPFDNAFFVRPGPASFLKTLRSAWKLRGRLGSFALDFDADPRTAFWLKISGVRRAVSYSRPYAVLFDDLFPIDLKTTHQADKNLAVASGFLEYHEKHFGNKISPPVLKPVAASSHSPESKEWIVSCWTRKDTKNWPLERWDGFLEKMLDAKISFRILEAPDGDEPFRAFQLRWSGRAPFLRGDLADISEAVRNAAGVIATDNFIGHMAAHYNKPLLWINGSSDPAQVMPKGPFTHCVQVDPMECRPCGHRCVNPEYKACLKRLDVETVWSAFARLSKG